MTTPIASLNPQPPFAESYLESLLTSLQQSHPQVQHWSTTLIDECLQSFDDGLDESHLDHLECLADHFVLLESQQPNV
jgi:hypothetical protein